MADSPSKRRYASLNNANNEAHSIKKVMPHSNYQSTIEAVRHDIKSPPSLNALKPPHRIPKIDIKTAGGLDPLSPAYNVSQTSPNRYDSRLEKRRGDNASQTPVNNANTGKVKKTKKASDLMDGSYEPELEGGSLHLVPCRWSLTGWKYVKVEPGDQKFFNSPHRINGQGIYTGNQSPQTKKKMLNILGGDNTGIVERKWIGDDKMSAEEIGTTYTKFFSPTKYDYYISLLCRLDELKDMQKKRFEYRNNLMKGQEGQFAQFTLPNGGNINPGVVNHSPGAQQ
jgi:hypothetical protein